MNVIRITTTILAFVLLGSSGCKKAKQKAASDEAVKKTRPVSTSLPEDTLYPLDTSDVTTPPRTEVDSDVSTQGKSTAAKSPKEGTKCKSTSDCPEGLQCSQVNSRCHTRASLVCHERGKCARMGRCFSVNGKCVARSALDCKQSKFVCRRLGSCSWKGGDECVAVSNADCRQSATCRNEGQCIVRDGSCSITSDADCQRSLACKKGDKCKANGKFCTWAAERNEECTAFRGKGRAGHVPCEEEGLCVASGGRCVAKSDEKCRQSEACSRSGKCSARNDKCVPLSDADCRRSKLCKSFGWCVLDGSGCWSGKKQNCAKTAMCRDFGHCSTMKDSAICGVTSDKDCAGSRTCKVHGRCVHRNGKCVKGP